MKKASVLMVALISAAAAFAANPHEVRFHNEASDTSRISELLVEGMRSLPADASPGDSSAPPTAPTLSKLPSDRTKPSW